MLLMNSRLHIHALFKKTKKQNNVLPCESQDVVQKVREVDLFVLVSIWYPTVLDRVGKTTDKLQEKRVSVAHIAIFPPELQRKLQRSCMTPRALPTARALGGQTGRCLGVQVQNG